MRDARDPDAVLRELLFRPGGASLQAALSDLQRRDALLLELVDALRCENEQLRLRAGLPPARRSWGRLGLPSLEVGTPAAAAHDRQSAGSSASPSLLSKVSAALGLDSNSICARCGNDTTKHGASSASALAPHRPPAPPPPPPPPPRLVPVAFDVHGTLAFPRHGGDLARALLDAVAREMAPRRARPQFARAGEAAAGGPPPRAALLFWREESRGAPDAVLSALAMLAPGAPCRAVVFLHRADLSAAAPARCRHEAFVGERLAAHGAAALDGAFDDMAPDVVGAALAAPQNAALVAALADLLAAV